MLFERVKEEDSMKKIVQVMLFVCLTVFGMQVAFANADKVTIPEGADIVSVKRLALAAPLYTPTKDAPTKEELLASMYEASNVARSYVLSYDMVAADIQKNTGVDIKSLDRRQAAKVYKENVAADADAYVVLTVANNSRIVFFYDIYRSGTNELLYTYQIVANRSQKANMETYKALSEQFYKNFERSANEQAKK